MHITSAEQWRHSKKPLDVEIATPLSIFKVTS